MLRIAQEALTFDDVLLLPAHSDVLPNEVSLKTRLTRNIELNVPLLSSAMDTVTEHRLAITMAQEGGIGILHKSMPVDDQARQVRAVKKYESGVVKDPITISPNATVRELINLTDAHNISGVPVVEGQQVVGIVTSRDTRFITDYDQSVADIMTGRDRLVTVKEGASADEVQTLLHKHRIEKILVVNDAGELRGMITVKDIEKATRYPNACKDSQGRLRVGAAVGTGGGTEERVADRHGRGEEGGASVLSDGREWNGFRNRIRLERRAPLAQVAEPRRRDETDDLVLAARERERADDRLGLRGEYAHEDEVRGVNDGLVVRADRHATGELGHERRCLLCIARRHDDGRGRLRQGAEAADDGRGHGARADEADAQPAKAMRRRRRGHRRAQE